MNCPNPCCEGSIHICTVPNSGKCNLCLLNCIRCFDSRENPSCKEWNAANAKFCRGCGRDFLSSQWFRSVEDYFENDLFLKNLKKEYDVSFGNLNDNEKDAALIRFGDRLLLTERIILRQCEIIDLKSLYGDSISGFTLYNAGNFLFFLSADGRLFTIPSNNTSYLISKNSKYREWKASVGDSYIVLYCSKQWRIIAQNLLELNGNFSILENPNLSCHWESLSHEKIILPNQKPLIWDIAGKHTFVAWVTITKDRDGFELNRRVISQKGIQYKDLPVIRFSDFTDENFFCWEKSPYSESPKALILCKKGLFEIDFSLIDDPAIDPVKLVIEIPQKPFLIDSSYKIWTPDLLLPVFLFRQDFPEILIQIDSVSSELTGEVIGVNPFKGKITTYGAKNAPGKPISLIGKKGFLTLNKSEIHECSFLSTSRKIRDDDINDDRCLGALSVGDLFFYWGIFFDGKNSLRKLEIKSLSNSQQGFSLTRRFISNPIISFDGIWYLDLSDDNKLKICLLNPENCDSKI